jgi:hypothetical protein
MTISAHDRPRTPQAPPTRGAAPLRKGAPRRARDPPVDCRDDRSTAASGLDRPPLFDPQSSSQRVNAAPLARQPIIGASRTITITGIGDHHRPEWPITFTGIRT